MAVHHLHHLYYHHLYLLLLVQYFILNLKIWLFGSSTFSFPTGLFHGIPDQLMFYSAQRLDLFAWCVRLSRLLVGFRTHLKSMHFRKNMLVFDQL